MKIRSDDRHKEALNWARRLAYSLPGVVATASIGEFHLSVWHDGQKLRYHQFYVREEAKE